MDQVAAAPPDDNTVVPDTRPETQYIPIALKVPKTVTSLLNVAVPVHVRVLASAVAPVTPNVVEHVALVIVVFPVTPRVPEHVAFTRVVAPVTPRGPEHVPFARVVAPVTPNVVEHVALVIDVLPVTPRVPEHACSP